MYANNSDGGWRCRVKVRARQNPANRDYYHRPDGGYVRRRLRHLDAQRKTLRHQLEQLAKEAAEC